MVIEVHEDKLDLYQELHADVWPTVVDKMFECNILFQTKMLPGFFNPGSTIEAHPATAGRVIDYRSRTRVFKTH